MKRKYYNSDGVFDYAFSLNAIQSVPTNGSILVPIKIDYFNVLDRIISVRLFLNVSSSTPISSTDAKNVIVYQNNSCTTVVDRAFKEQDNNYLVFDISRIILDNLTLQVFLKKATSTPVTVNFQNSYVLFEVVTPFESIKEQSLIDFGIGKGMDIKVDRVTFLHYITKPLFSNIFTNSYSLIYDSYDLISRYLFFPKGWKLNILERVIEETIDGETSLILEDSSFNKRRFKKVSSNNQLFLDTSRTGIFLEIQSNNTYKLYSPLVSSHKLFDSTGLIYRIVKENGEEISFSYSSTNNSGIINQITIIDPKGNEITCLYDYLVGSISISTAISSTTINYTLAMNSDGFLTALTYESSEQTDLDIVPNANDPYNINSDFFVYDSNNRLVDITSYDNYNLLINFDTSNDFQITFSLAFDQHDLKTRYLRREKSYVVYEEDCNEVCWLYYYDDKNAIFASGEHAGFIGDSEYYASPDGVFYHRFRNQQVDNTNLIRPTFSDTSSNGFHINNSTENIEITKITDAITVTQQTYYLLFFMANTNLKYPLRRYDDGAYINEHVFEVFYNSEDYDKHFLTSITKNGIQYYYGIFNSGALDQATIIFKLSNNIGEVIVSDVYLIKLNDFIAPVLFPSISGDSSILVDNITYVEALNIYFTLNDKNINLYPNDIKTNRYLYFKNQNTNIFFYNDLGDVLLNDNNIQIKVGLNNTFTFQNKVAAFGNKENGKTTIEIPSFYASALIKTNSYLLINGNTYYKYSVVNYHGVVLESTNYFDIKTVNTPDSSFNITSSEKTNSDNSLSIVSSSTYDLLNRLTSITSMVGNNTDVVNSFNYVSTSDVLSNEVDGKNKTTYYSFSKHFEYVYSITKDNHIVLNKYTSSSNLLYASDNQSKFLFSYNGENELNGISYKYISNNTPTIVNLLSINKTVDNGSETKIFTYSNNSVVTMTSNLRYGRVISVNYGNNQTVSFSYSSPYSSFSSLKSDARLSQIIDNTSTDSSITNITYNSFNSISNVLISNNVGTISYDYSFDSFKRLDSKKEIISGASYNNVNQRRKEVSFSYNVVNDLIESTTSVIKKPLSFSTIYVPDVSASDSVSRDSLNRVATVSVAASHGLSLTPSSYITYSHSYYNSSNDSKTSYQVEKVTYEDNTFVRYKYDKNGNINMILDENATVEASLTYDSNNQLIQEYRPKNSYKTITYTYDNYGNILSAYKTGTGMPSQYTYFEYSTIHPNVLINYNGSPVSYDGLFNITSLNGATMTYCKVSMLSTYQKGTTNASYFYNYNGIRTKKVVNNCTHSYVLDGDKISREIVELSVSPYTKYQIIYLYGINGVIGFYYNNKLYLYRKNLFNDIIEIYETSSLGKTMVAKYHYLNAYGDHEVLNPDETINNNSNFIGHINPFRYRSYYFDEESGYYYCNHRYYVPFIYRWLTMDNLSYLDSTSINGINLFAYCKNNPVMYADEDGTMPAILAILILGLFGSAIGFAAQSITDLATNRGFDLGRSAIAAAAGFVGGMASAIPLCGVFISSALTSGLNTIGQMAYSKKKYSVGAYFLNFAVSSTVGVVSSIAFGQITSCIPFFNNISFFRENYVKFVTNWGGIQLANSVIAKFTCQIAIYSFLVEMLGSAFEFSFSCIINDFIENILNNFSKDDELVYENN